jgi:hypothetical protein
VTAAILATMRAFPDFRNILPALYLGILAPILSAHPAGRQPGTSLKSVQSVRHRGSEIEESECRPVRPSTRGIET